MQAFNSKLINILFLSGFFVVIAGSFARYYFLKEFPINIEVPCDSTLELCFHRDCEIEDECPPNGLSDYRQFEILGRTFATCSEIDGCEVLCKTTSECTEIVCGEDEEDVCTELPEPVSIPEDVEETEDVVEDQIELTEEAEETL
jgi:hypothetical protein